MLPPDNFQDDPAAGRRPPHLADQHRAVPAVDGRRPRLRLDRHARDGRAARGDAGDDRAASSASAATSTTGTTRATCGRSTRLRLVGRQRQPGRPPARARQRLPRAWRGTPRRCARHASPASSDALDARPRGAARACPTTGAPSSSSPRELAGALDELAAALPQLPDRAGRARAATPATAADIARALASERGDDAERATCCSGSRPSQRSLESHRRDVAQRCRSRSRRCERRLQTLEATARAPWPATMDFGFLFDPSASCFSIGYRVADGQLDPSYYDLLASEARLASFVAIAKGDVPAAALVPARPRADAGRPRLGADLVVGLDVRVPDAVAGHARAAPAACSSRPTGWSCAGRSTTAPSAACRGASPSRPTTRATSS